MNELNDANDPLNQSIPFDTLTKSEKINLKHYIKSLNVSNWKRNHQERNNISPLVKTDDYIYQTKVFIEHSVNDQNYKRRKHKSKKEKGLINVYNDEESWRSKLSNESKKELKRKASNDSNGNEIVKLRLKKIKL